MTKGKSEKILFLSGLEFLSKGSLTGLWHLAADAAKHEGGVNFVVIAGRVVSYKGFKERLKEEIEDVLLDREMFIELQKEQPKAERVKPATITDTKALARETLLDKVALELSESIPKFPGLRGSTAKVYVVVSRAANYDGPIGVEVMQRLSRLRKDIVFWGTESTRFPLKSFDKEIGVLLPRRAAWRSKYYSTGATRLVEDEEKRSSKKLPAFWVVGTGGSAVHDPAGGERLRPMITLPVVHEIQDIKTSENQVGARVVEVFEDSEFPVVRTYSFKDYTNEKVRFVNLPTGLTQRQRDILKILVKRDEATIGMLEDALGFARRTIEREIASYNKSGTKPRIVCDEDSGKFYIDPAWLRSKLKFPFPEMKKMKKTSMLGFGCLHAGYTKTQYKWFVERVSELLHKRKVDYLVGAGDFVAGLKHNLMMRGEIYSGANLTKQQKWAARLVAAVLVNSFKKNFEEALKRKRKSPTNKTLVKMLKQSLPKFLFIDGNHDAWDQDDGHDPLALFRSELPRMLEKKLSVYLADKNFGSAIESLSGVVDEAVIYSQEHKLGNGLGVSMRHPRQGRMQTVSGRAQQTLETTKGSMLWIANFHTSVEVLEWDPDRGQRLALQVGTITSGTDFESNMNKLVDTGVAVGTVYLDPDTNRIFMTETVWDSPSEDEIVVLDNERPFEDFNKELNI